MTRLTDAELAQAMELYGRSDNSLIGALISEVEAGRRLAEAAQRAIMDTPHRNECAETGTLKCVCWQRYVAAALAAFEKGEP